MANKLQLILASASPRRAELLKQIGLNFKIVPANIDETIDPSMSICDVVAFLSAEKARACQSIIRDKPETRCLPILAADTLVLVDQERILSKPIDRDGAVRMLRLISGSSHVVYTSVSVLVDRTLESRVASAQVKIRSISEEEISAYCDSGEPFDKAGAYGLQGIGGIFVEQITGQPSTVVGLPLVETEELLRKFNVDTWQLRVI
ncbi:MAG: Maf family protein [Gammaproteobacteria bacterium]|nr:Maf family protein [Gammaproteobacteria bacterium]